VTSVEVAEGRDENPGTRSVITTEVLQRLDLRRVAIEIEESGAVATEAS
jgi:hypothetical protein